MGSRLDLVKTAANIVYAPLQFVIIFKRKIATAHILTLAARHHWKVMRSLIISLLFILSTLSVFGQRSVKNAYILVDGHEKSYKEYKKLNLTKFAEINVLAEKGQTIQVFGKKAKHGVVHLRTREFNDKQKKIINDLKAEFRENRVETTLIVINGVPYDRDQFQQQKIERIDYGTVEWIAILEDTGMLNHKKVVVIQTNVVL
jgi:hypothetical protein